MQRLEVSGAVRPIYGSLGVKRLIPSRVRFSTVIPRRLHLASHQPGSHLDKRRSTAAVSYSYNYARFSLH